MCRPNIGRLLVVVVVVIVVLEGRSWGPTVAVAAEPVWGSRGRWKASHPRIRRSSQHGC
jgi:hypothetical protein